MAGDKSDHNDNRQDAKSEQLDYREESKCEPVFAQYPNQSSVIEEIEEIPKQRTMTSHQFYTFKTVKPIESQPGRKAKRRKQLLTNQSVPETTTAFAHNYDPSEEMLLRLLKNLQEKHNNKTLSALDHKLLVKLQEVVAQNPRNYSAKLGYLQLTYNLPKE